MAGEKDKIIRASRNREIIKANSHIPYALLNEEIEGSSNELSKELTEIASYYKAYNEGSKFNPEGTAGDYTPATLRYRLAASLINKEARFLFAERPDIKIDAKGDLGKVTQETKDALTIMQDLIDTVLKKNKFEKILLQAARDCFIGKRVAGIINFNEESGVTITFLPAMNFLYETKLDNPEVLDKFVSFTIIRDRQSLKDKLIYKKKFKMETQSDGKEICYMEEKLYNGAGSLVETISEYQPTLLDRIPVAIFTNDGLLGDEDGISEMQILSDYEAWFSKLSNSDIDSMRKNMNPIRYTVDMDSSSTANLSSAPGSFWDLASDQNIDNSHAATGIIESSMNYSTALGETLKRIKATMYEQIDMPDISLESLQGIITSGKALKGIYWPLIVRSKEKMKTWGPEIEYMIDTIIQGAIVYPNCIKRYTDDTITPVSYEIHVENKYPLPEDETEEKQNDLSEVSEMTMSKKSYMKKWRGLTDQEADEELNQIAIEKAMFESNDGFVGQNSFGESDGTEASFDEDELDTKDDNIDEEDEKGDVDNEIGGDQK